MSLILALLAWLLQEDAVGDEPDDENLRGC